MRETHTRTHTNDESWVSGRGGEAALPVQAAKTMFLWSTGLPTLLVMDIFQRNRSRFGSLVHSQESSFQADADALHTPLSPAEHPPPFSPADQPRYSSFTFAKGVMKVKGV